VVTESARHAPAAGDAERDLPLFRVFPQLRSRLARHPFIDAPTPAEPLRLPGLPEAKVFVKRDDRSCALYGGNKPRKLEFLIGRALERGSRRLVTSGAIGTHHGLATTILGRAVGLKTSLVLVPQPETEEVRRSLELDEEFGAEVVRAAGVKTAALQTVRVLARSQLLGEKPHLVWPGGSTPAGNLGFVSAGLELAEQVREGHLPEPAEIWLAVGSGGTAAGLVVGLKLAKLRTRVRGVAVSDVLPPSAASLLRAARATLALLRRHAPEAPALDISAADFPLDWSELGAGYGAATTASTAAQQLASEAGLELDATYTAKCFAALLAEARRGAFSSQPVLFWNTYAGSSIQGVGCG